MNDVEWRVWFWKISEWHYWNHVILFSFQFEFAFMQNGQVRPTWRDGDKSSACSTCFLLMLWTKLLIPRFSALKQQMSNTLKKLGIFIMPVKRWQSYYVELIKLQYFGWSNHQPDNLIWPHLRQIFQLETYRRVLNATFDNLPIEHQKLEELECQSKDLIPATEQAIRFPLGLDGDAPPSRRALLRKSLKQSIIL